MNECFEDFSILRDKLSLRRCDYSESPSIIFNKIMAHFYL